MPLNGGGSASTDPNSGGMNVDHANQPDPALTLAAIQETFLNELVAAVGGMKGHICSLAGRMDNVENQVTSQLQQTINHLEDMTTKYYKQENIQQLMQETGREFDERLKRLEQRGVGSEVDPSEGSTVDTEGILGGWDPENYAAETLQEAKQVLQNVAIELDVLEIFVPGVRRGYALIPVPDRPGKASTKSEPEFKTPSPRYSGPRWSWGPSQPGNHSAPGLHFRKTQSEDAG